MKYDLRRPDTVTSSSVTITYVDSFTVVPVPWYRRLWRWFR